MSLVSAPLYAAESGTSSAPKRDAAEFRQRKSVEVAKALVGSWNGVSFSRDGEPFKRIAPKDASIELPNRYVYSFDFRSPAENVHNELSNVRARTGPPRWLVDATKTPMEFFLVTGNGRDVSLDRSAVFQLEGDTLTWRVVDQGESPPFTLTTKKGDGHIVVRLEKRRENREAGKSTRTDEGKRPRARRSRHKEVPDKRDTRGAPRDKKGSRDLPQDASVFAGEKSSKVAKALSGNWIGVSFSRDGKPFQPIGPKGARLSLPNRSMYLFKIETPGGDAGQSGSGFKLGRLCWGVDATKTPMEFFIIAGLPKLAAERMAIFELHGDDLTWCIVATSEKPPLSLTTKKGDGHTVVRFRREKGKKRGDP